MRRLQQPQLLLMQSVLDQKDLWHPDGPLGATHDAVLLAVIYNTRGTIRRSARLAARTFYFFFFTVNARSYDRTGVLSFPNERARHGERTESIFPVTPAAMPRLIVTHVPVHRVANVRPGINGGLRIPPDTRLAYKI